MSDKIFGRDHIRLTRQRGAHHASLRSRSRKASGPERKTPSHGRREGLRTKADDASHHTGKDDDQNRSLASRLRLHHAMASRCCSRDAGDGLDSERLMSTMNRTYSSSSIATVDSRQSKGASISPAESIRTIFSKTAFPLIELWKISFHPLFIGVRRFSGSKNWGMSSSIALDYPRF